MGYSTAIDAIKAKVLSVSALALVYCSDPRLRSLADAPRGKFDGAFLLRNEGGGLPFREMVYTTPNASTAAVALEISTELTNDAFTQEKTVEGRASGILGVLLTANMSDVIDLQPTGTPSVSVIDRRMLWTQKFNLIYLEN